MIEIVKRFAKDEAASVTAEYGLVAAGLSIAIIAMVQGIGIRLAANLPGAQNALR